jgi:hypothetical protein
MASPAKKPRGKRALVEQWLAARGAAVVEESDLEELRAVSGLSSGYLRRILRESGAPLAAMVEGVRQDDFASLERTLLALLEEYQRGDRARRQAVRRLVIEAKDHARWAARTSERKAEKEEMMLWMLTWLENPPLFPHWAALRRRVAEGGRA